MRYDICGVPGGVINLHFRAVRTLLGSRILHAVFYYGLKRIYVFFLQAAPGSVRDGRLLLCRIFLPLRPIVARKIIRYYRCFPPVYPFFFFLLTFFAFVRVQNDSTVVPLFIFIYLSKRWARTVFCQRTWLCAIVVCFKINQVYKSRGFVFLTSFRRLSTKDLLFPRRLGKVVSITT